MSSRPFPARGGADGPADVGHGRDHASPEGNHHLYQHHQHLLLGPCNPVGLGLIKNWYQVTISIPSLGTGIQGIGPLLNPKPIVGALSPLLHSGLLSSAYTSDVTAIAGQVGTIGALSVPQNWASAVPASG